VRVLCGVNVRASAGVPHAGTPALPYNFDEARSAPALRSAIIVSNVGMVKQLFVPLFRGTLQGEVVFYGVECWYGL
jgi:hypothetical protein